MDSALNTTFTPTFSLEPFVLLGFYLLLAIYIIFTGMFYYHWHQYSTNNTVTRLTFIAYFVSTLPIVAGLSLVVLLF